MLYVGLFLRRARAVEALRSSQREGGMNDRNEKTLDRCCGHGGCNDRGGCDKLTGSVARPRHEVRDRALLNR